MARYCSRSVRGSCDQEPAASLLSNLFDRGVYGSNINGYVEVPCTPSSTAVLRSSRTDTVVWSSRENIRFKVHIFEPGIHNCFYGLDGSSLFVLLFKLLNRTFSSKGLYAYAYLGHTSLLEPRNDFHTRILVGDAWIATFPLKPKRSSTI